MCYSKSECTELEGRSVGQCDDDGGEDGPVCCIGELLDCPAGSRCCMVLQMAYDSLLCY